MHMRIHHHNQLTVMFFALLPFDVQRLILQTWIRGDFEHDDDRETHNFDLLRTLRALDIACCSHIQRHRFLQLVENLPLLPCNHKSDVSVCADVTEYTLVELISLCCEDAASLLITDALIFLSWATTRNIAVRSLYLSAHNLMPNQQTEVELEGFAHHVDSIYVGDLEVETKPLAPALLLILQHCPNVAFIKLTTAVMWRELASLMTAPMPTVQQLVVHDHDDKNWHDSNFFTIANLSHFPSLTVLQMPKLILNVEGIAAIAHCCHEMRVLSFHWDCYEVGALCDSVKCLLQLEELEMKVDLADWPSEEVLHLADSCGPMLKKLKATECDEMDVDLDFEDIDIPFERL